jgi:glutamine amidotransferase-like uncharacterized protein
VLLLQSQSATSIVDGFAADEVPEPYVGGLGQAGSDEVRAFVRNGGRLVAIEEATQYAIDLFTLDVRDETSRVPPTELYIPGSILRLEVDSASEIGSGMRSEVAAWYWTSSRAFSVGDARVRVVARYATGDPLLSGWAIGSEAIAGQPAILEADVGDGSVVLFGFQPNYRAQSMATWPLLFNAIRR